MAKTKNAKIRSELAAYTESLNGKMPADPNTENETFMRWMEESARALSDKMNELLKEKYKENPHVFKHRTKKKS